GHLGDQVKADADADHADHVDPPPVGVPSPVPTVRTWWRMDPCFF
ncbi:hypothetical protein A2U01_0092791, partial [Trifolium medium]|nr:hypothetical protein [Trifolium medium]